MSQLDTNNVKGTVVSIGAADLDIRDVGFTPTVVTLINVTNEDEQIIQVSASGLVEPLVGQTPADAVNYDDQAGGSDGGTVGDAEGDGFKIVSGLLGYTQAGDSGDTIQWIASR